MDAFERAEMTRKLRRLEEELDKKNKQLKKNVIVYEEHSDDKDTELMKKQVEAISNNVEKISKQLETFAIELVDKLSFMKNVYPADVSVAQIKDKRTRKDKEYIPKINKNVDIKIKHKKEKRSTKGVSDALDALSNLGSDE